MATSWRLETSRRRLRDLLETGKSLKQNRTCLSRRRFRNQRRLESPTSRQASEIGAQLPETFPQLRRRLGDVASTAGDVAATSPRLAGELVVTSEDVSEKSPWWERKPFLVSRVARVAATDQSRQSRRRTVGQGEPKTGQNYRMAYLISKSLKNNYFMYEFDEIGLKFKE